MAESSPSESPSSVLSEYSAVVSTRADSSPRSWVLESNAGTPMAPIRARAAAGMGRPRHRPKKNGPIKTAENPPKPPEGAHRHKRPLVMTTKRPARRKGPPTLWARHRRDGTKMKWRSKRRPTIDHPETIKAEIIRPNIFLGRPSPRDVLARHDAKHGGPPRNASPARRTRPNTEM